MNTFSKVSAQAFQQRTFVPGQGQLLRYRFCHGGTIQPAKGNRGGWDVTIAPTDFRKIDQKVICEVIDFLNQIEGRPYFGEDCTGLVERAFGKRRLFADSPTAGLIGFGMRVGDPALMLLRSDAQFDPKTKTRLRADVLRALPDPRAVWDDPNGRLWIKRGLLALTIVALVVGLKKLPRSRSATPKA